MISDVARLSPCARIAAFLRVEAGEMCFLSRVVNTSAPDLPAKKILPNAVITAYLRRPRLQASRRSGLRFQLYHILVLFEDGGGAAPPVGHN